MSMTHVSSHDIPDEEDQDASTTPVMRQYREIKRKYPGTILFFRIGDFYETFERDAELISRELDIVLTSRSKSGENRIPLAGVPYHAADGYIARLVSKGYKVAVVDQVGDAKNTRGIVKRELVRVITPGTVIDSAMVSSSASTFLLALCPDVKNRQWGMALLDISTGEFFAVVSEHDPAFENILSEIARYRPAECILPPGLPSGLSERIRERGVTVTVFRNDEFSEEKARHNLVDHFHVASLAGFGVEGFPSAIGAAGAAIAYAKETQNAPLAHISGLSLRSSGESLMLDAVTLRNLEVNNTIRPDPKGADALLLPEPDKNPHGKPSSHAPSLPPVYQPG